MCINPICGSLPEFTNSTIRAECGHSEVSVFDISTGIFGSFLPTKIASVAVQKIPAVALNDNRS